MFHRLRFVFLVPLAALALFAGTAGSAIAAPANDNFAARQTISGPLPLTVAANNIGATAEVGEPMIGGNAPLKTVWFSWTAPSTQQGRHRPLCRRVPRNDLSPPSVSPSEPARPSAQLLVVTETIGRCALRLTPVAGSHLQLPD